MIKVKQAKDHGVKIGFKGLNKTNKNDSSYDDSVIKTLPSNIRSSM